MVQLEAAHLLNSKTTDWGTPNSEIDREGKRCVIILFDEKCKS